MAFEKFFPNSKSEYGEGVMLQEYAGKWYLVDARRPNKGDGTVYKSYGYRTRKDKGKTITVDNDQGEPRSFPWSVCIGYDIAQATGFLKAALAQLPQNEPGPPPATDNDDIPF